MNAARQYEQGARDRTEVAVPDATAQTQVDMLQEFFRIEQVAENTFAKQQVVISNQMNAVAEHAIQGQRPLLMSETFTEFRHRDEVHRQQQVLN